MPPRTRKRALADAEEAEQPPPPKAPKAKGKKQSKKASETEDASASGDGSKEDNHDHDHDCDCDHDEMAKRAPYEYYCLQRPFYDYEKENEEKDDDEQLDEDELGEQYNAKVAGAKDTPANKPAAEHPDYKWISMWRTWTKCCDLKKRAFYTCPDAFGMYIYNDFNGYGIQELVQNTLIDFDKEFSKKTHNDDRLNEMWCIASSFVHWLLQDELGPWFMMDDGELFTATNEMIDLMFVTVLNELDQANLLKSDSRIKDLGLVMACFLQWSDIQEEFGATGDEGGVDLPKEIIAYAKKAGIDLKNVGLHGIKEKLEQHGYDAVEPLSGNAKADRWAWKKKFTAFKKDNGITAGEKYNILKMSRKERASYAFDKKDPLKSVSEKDLREGNIMPA
ncbi:hypothetical protein MGN70_001148 [Eutypa lata]|nr:hypothetical protein MGN70_001148 [Eutypa lata]